MQWKIQDGGGNEGVNLGELSQAEFDAVQSNILSRDAAHDLCPTYVEWIEGDKSAFTTVFTNCVTARRGQDMITAVMFNGKTCYLWAKVGSVAWRSQGKTHVLPLVTAVVRHKSKLSPRMAFQTNGYYQAPKGWYFMHGTRASFQAVDKLMESI